VVGTSAPIVWREIFLPAEITWLDSLALPSRRASPRCLFSAARRSTNAVQASPDSGWSSPTSRSMYRLESLGAGAFAVRPLKPLICSRAMRDRGGAFSFHSGFVFTGIALAV